ncbi:uncharacterized protein SAMN04488127_2297 [Bhargavaea ginsengi]|uniref:DUF418 domain-containing protein n=1 Tax=Bhargavaea ginsengi TaxID=426757 RepID=A0A1H7A864_9BACL|nr:DUF418 domain-containing protein [Bhargavaea ginsengi]SEJ61618.1 uncharacterized protein SAMN04488127_2297 [Bhargavaea ginsengi]
MPTLKPTASSERIAALDYLRGFALLGIFVANMLFFHTPFVYIDPFTWFRSLSDEVSHMWVDILFQSSFYPLFAMLFGYGMNMQYEKAVSLGKPFVPTAAKRMGVLLLFGIIHAFLIWPGDILITYALMGLIFMWLIRLPAAALTAIGAVVYVVPMAGLALLTFFVEKLDPEGMMGAYADITNINRSIEAYAGGSFGEVTAQRAADWMFMNSASLPMAIFMILPLFMFGAAAGKAKLIEKASDNWKKWILPAVLFTAIGLTIKSLPYFSDLRYTTQVVQDSLGGPILTVGYVGLVLLLLQSGLVRKVFHPVASAGRMSLTVYLTQSIIATLIFYSYGLGYYGKVSVSLGTWMAVAIFAIQCILANLYFQKFRQGPFERIWRRLVYGK